jgi:hypothetical protein
MIEEKIEKYLKEGNEKADLEKMRKVIASIDHPSQIKVAANMAVNYVKMYGYDTFLRVMHDIYMDVVHHDAQPTKEEELKLEFRGDLDRKFIELYNKNPEAFAGNRYNRGDILKDLGRGGNQFGSARKGGFK